MVNKIRERVRTDILIKFPRELCIIPSAKYKSKDITVKTKTFIIQIIVELLKLTAKALKNSLIIDGSYPLASFIVTLYIELKAAPIVMIGKEHSKNKRLRMIRSATFVIKVKNLLLELSINFISTHPSIYTNL